MSQQIEQPKKVISLPRKITYSLILLIVLVAVITLLGEIFTRILSDGKYDKPDVQPPFDTALKDDYLGWKMTPNYSFSGTVKDELWQDYPISIKYDGNGFKAFGDINSDKPKVFFIGDSYIASVEASNEKTFYSILKDSLDFELFAYGHSGYGTLQEYMILDMWIDKIKPDLIVWGVCNNDHVDNNLEYDKACVYTVGERRPYLRNTEYGIRNTEYGIRNTEYGIRNILRFTDYWVARAKKENLFLCLARRKG